MPEASKRRLMTREAAMAVARRLLDHNVRTQQVAVEHIVSSNVKVLGGGRLETNDGDIVRIGFPSAFGANLENWVSTNQLDDAVLAKVIAETIDNAPALVVEADGMTDIEEVQLQATAPHPLPPVSLYHDASIRAMGTIGEDSIPQLVGQLQASRLDGAATVSAFARSVLYLYRDGLASFAEETDCEVTVTARSPDGRSTGWSGQAHRDWSRMTPSAVATRAIELATRGNNPVAIEPGRRIAILGPAAVAQLVRAMPGYFDFKFGGIGPLGYSDPSHPRKTKMGERVLDPRLMFISDPADPDGGYPPFFELGGKDSAGFPTPAMRWIDRGILKGMAMNVTDAALRALTPSENPYSLRIAAAPGVPTHTLDEMVANCREGVYINRFSNTRLIDPPSALLTGVTRDGCFLVKDGKIAKPIMNLRFLDSPFGAFNRIEMIGMPERVAFGNQADEREGTPRDGMPRLPVIVPPVMVRDFNFSALAAAV